MTNVFNAINAAVNGFKAAVNSIPKPIRDFIEGLAATGVGGAADSVFQLNLGLASPRLVWTAAIVGGLNAAISYARREGIKPVVEAAAKGPA